MFPQNDLSFHPDQRLAHSTARFGRAGIALPVAVSKMDEPIEPLEIWMKLDETT